MELLSLTNDNDLVLAKIGNYHLCLAESSKRVYGLDWFKAKEYCKSLGEGYSLPSKEEFNLIYKNKGSLSLVEACLYGEAVNSLDFISQRCSDEHPHYPLVWSSSEYKTSGAWFQSLSSGSQDFISKGYTPLWVFPIRRLLV